MGAALWISLGKPDEGSELTFSKKPPGPQLRWLLLSACILPTPTEPCSRPCNVLDIRFIDQRATYSAQHSPKHRQLGARLASSAATRKPKGSHQGTMRQDWTHMPQHQICCPSVASETHLNQVLSSSTSQSSFPPPLTQDSQSPSRYQVHIRDEFWKEGTCPPSHGK